MHLINEEVSFDKEIAFYTLVTRIDEYREMVESAKRAGFDNDNINFYYFDNSNSNRYHGYNGINYAIKSSNARYIIFCHQDILFSYDNYDKLMNCIKDLNNIDPNWAVAGNAGKNNLDEFVIRISYLDEYNISEGDFPSEVISVDENFIIINNKLNLSCSSQLNGYHLYGLDICNNARYLGYKSYVIDFNLLHKSRGNIDKSFYNSKSNYINLGYNRKKNEILPTTCDRIYISNSKFKNFFCNISLFIRLYSYIKFKAKKIFK